MNERKTDFAKPNTLPTSSKAESIPQNATGIDFRNNKLKKNNKIGEKKDRKL